uniref:Pentatricopeptide repeat-containing protein At4g21170-like n=1 Tax=Nicotiana tabacum TaxID=4097 RepID=A0A1S4CPU6_TOBAC|nr:PREDICTED: pentatricopeptide repeat-containing protein At4g21170-like [Nicotiana tabacum]
MKSWGSSFRSHPKTGGCSLVHLSNSFCGSLAAAGLGSGAGQGQAASSRFCAQTIAPADLSAPVMATFAGAVSGPLLRSLATPLLVRFYGSWLAPATGQAQASVLSSVLDCYCNKGLLFEGLQVYRKVREYRYFISTDSCNALLNLLYRKNELRLAWCYYGSIIKNCVQENVFTWSLIAQMLCKYGKFEQIVSIIDKGLCTHVMYNILIDCYSKRGDFEAAFIYLNNMYRKSVDPTFSTFSSILDGTYKYQNAEVIVSLMSSMVEKGHFSKVMLPNYSSIIQKLSDLGKTYAAELFFREASEKRLNCKITPMALC